LRHFVSFLWFKTAASERSAGSQHVPDRRPSMSCPRVKIIFRERPAVCSEVHSQKGRRDKGGDSASRPERGRRWRDRRSPGRAGGGVLGGILGGIGHPPAPPPPAPVVHQGPYRVGGKVQAPRLIRQVEPEYPPLARQARVQGDVIIDSMIDTEGRVTQMKVVSGSSLLVQSAIQALEQWRYQPTLLNGQPVPVEMLVTLHFTLGQHS